MAERILMLAFDEKEGLTMFRALVDYQQNLTHSSLAATAEGAEIVLDEIVRAKKLLAALGEATYAEEKTLV